MQPPRHGCRSADALELGLLALHLDIWTRVLSQVGHMKQSAALLNASLPSSTYQTLSYLGTTDTGTGSPVIQISKTGVTHDISQMDMRRQTDK